ncbi:metal ABC transporter solute-binding protein, Zn/Mn family [Plasticicumulans sp.]|uniref:metal ABC transporter solute-binding protein, Zn/Mn family n=1 Tax=Plasticicumulans sp. TaxID=2307179 RepID=UPI0039259299
MPARAASFAPLAGKPFIVFHDAYQYFEHRYGLTAVGSITVSPERKPSAQRIQAVRDRIRETGACVFAEPQFDSALVATLTEGTGARAGSLDLDRCRRRAGRAGCVCAGAAPARRKPRRLPRRAETRPGPRGAPAGHRSACPGSGRALLRFPAIPPRPRALPAPPMLAALPVEREVPPA